MKATTFAHNFASENPTEAKIRYRPMRLCFEDGTEILVEKLGHNAKDGVFDIDEYPHRKNDITDHNVMSRSHSTAARSADDGRKRNGRPRKYAKLEIGQFVHIVLDDVQRMYEVLSVDPIRLKSVGDMGWAKKEKVGT